MAKKRAPRRRRTPTVGVATTLGTLGGLGNQFEGTLDFINIAMKPNTSTPNFWKSLAYKVKTDMTNTNKIKDSLIMIGGPAVAKSIAGRHNPTVISLGRTLRIKAL